MAAAALGIPVLVILAFSGFIVVIALALIPVYIGTGSSSTAATSQMETTVQVDDVGTVDASGRILTLIDGTTVDTTDTDNSVKEIFASLGAIDTNVTYTDSASNNVFTISCTVTFVENVLASLNDTEAENSTVYTTAFIESILNNFLTKMQTGFRPPTGFRSTLKSKYSELTVKRKFRRGGRDLRPFSEIQRPGGDTTTDATTEATTEATTDAATDAATTDNSSAEKTTDNSSAEKTNDNSSAELTTAA